METLEESIIKFKLKRKDKRRCNGRKAHKINDAVRNGYRTYLSNKVKAIDKPKVS